MRSPLRLSLCAAAVVGALGLGLPSASADGTVGVLVVKEHGVGSAAQAQPYVDKFVAAAAKLAGWAGAKGQYVTSRAQADTYIQNEKPKYGIFSLGAFLGMKGKHGLEPIGQVQVARLGGQQYFLVAKAGGDVGACKGKKVASDHADDPRFIDTVVAGGAFTLADFQLVATTRPIQTIKKVVAGEADCALIDDAQYEELGKIDGASGLAKVWSSAKLPPMVVVAFPSAAADERKKAQDVLAKVCEGEGKTACAEVGLQSIKPAGAGDYAGVVAAYGK